MGKGKKMCRLSDKLFFRVSWANDPSKSHLVSVPRPYYPSTEDVSESMWIGRAVTERTDVRFPGHKVAGWEASMDKDELFLIDRKGRLLGRVRRVEIEDLTEDEILAEVYQDPEAQ